ncbi:hypothetical protein CEQ90_03450 [Lewinellaceae bacterium SD302]|nr:hypothetical protein CEQ90_03450 [Lewinellaceae bacterium SD302]
MLFNISQLLFLLLFCLGLAALFKARWWRFLVAALGALAVAIETMSVLIGSSLIDYKFYAHFKIEVATAVGGFFFWQVLGAIAILLISGILIFRGSHWLRSLTAIAWPSLLVTVLAFAVLFLPEGIGSNIASISEIHFAKETAFNEALENSGVKDYTLVEDIKAKPGKNIIAIFMESLEIGYLQEKLAHLTPNMNRLREGEMNFYPMTQNSGGNYTIGALYTYMTGFPMHFKNHGNDVFDEVVDFRLSSVPAVLNKAGYHQEYLAGKPEFAGMDVMLELMGMEVKSEYDYDPKYNVRPWGLHDRDLFEIVDFELDRLYEEEQPFAYFVSTISTHATDGVYDARVEKDYPKQASRLELMALALDDYIGDLVEKLKANRRLENTAIYILPDHLLLSDYSRVLDDFEDPRGLFLLTNTSNERFRNGATINQAHLPRILLEGAEIEHNLVTLADQLPNDPRKELAKLKLPLLQLNEASLTKDKNGPDNTVVTKLGEQFELKEDELRLISKGWSGDNSGKPSYIFVGQKTLKVRRGINMIFRQDGEFGVDHFDLYGDSSQVDRLLDKIRQAHQNNTAFWLLAHDSVGKVLPKKKDELLALDLPKLSNLKGKKAYLAHFDRGYTSEKQKSKVVDATFPLIDLVSNRSEEQILADAKDRSKWIAHAGGAINGIKYANFLEALDHNYAKGYRYIELDIIETSDGHYVAGHDWKQWKGRTTYKGDIPVSREVFMQYKQRGNYTPMDMEMINEWFSTHPDAILVSDKVNDPVRFAREFVDKSRLIMELFSFDAIRAARGLGLMDVLVTEKLTNELGGNWVKRLGELEAGGLAISINTIMKNPDRYRKLKKAGIKTYAFHIGNNHLRDENFMARYGLDLAYGLYADEWDLR